MDDNIFTNIFLPLTLVVIMFGMGMGLQAIDFKRLLTRPKSVTLGLFNQIIILPLLGFAIAITLQLPPPIAVGIMILAACPGGPTSNLICHLCRADVALSISLTALSSLSTVFTIPLIIGFSLNFFMHDDSSPSLQVIDSILKIILLTLVPTILGMLTRRIFPHAAVKAQRWVSLCSIVLFAVVISGAIASQWANLPTFFEKAGFAALALNLSALAIGLLTARLFGLGLRRGTTIAIESGMQNGTLAITLASSEFFLNRPDLTIAPAIYSLIMFATAAMVIFATRRRLALDHF